ncbi:IS5 family transposase [Paraburkholderia sp. 40]
MRINEHTPLSPHAYTLKEGTAVDAMLIATPCSTTNKGGERGPEMHQTKTWRFGATCRIDVDADLGLAHTVVGTTANVRNAT